MDAEMLLTYARTGIGYHEKAANTPVSGLYGNENSYDGYDNWTKFQYEITNNLSLMGGSWCGFFCFWVAMKAYGSVSAATSALHGIPYYGGLVDNWVTYFNSVGKWHDRTSGYTPKAGDFVVYDADYETMTHVEIIESVSNYPTLTTIGGNTSDPNRPSPGTESNSVWCTRRYRSASATSGFWVRGYCEMDYDTESGLPEYMMKYWLRKKKRKYTMY